MQHFSRVTHRRTRTPRAESKGEFVLYLRKLPVKASDPTRLPETHAGCVAYGLLIPALLPSY